MAWYDILGGIVDAGAKLFNVGYNMYTNQRDFDYQRALQEQMFQREDTAVQRRMQDLQAAGLNPNLAAGSAAQSGAVVSRSNTNDLNMGSMLDTISAMNQIKQQRQQTENLKLEHDILDYESWIKSFQKETAALENNYNQMLLLHKMGYDVIPRGNGGGYIIQTETNGRPKNYSRGFKEYDEQLKNLENSNKYLDKELKYQTADHIADYVKSAGGLIKLIH